jgi:hypothetical protein
MVQFFKGSADPRDAAYGKLAEALGGGIGNGLNTYFANRSLNSVLQDKALEGAPQSEKLTALHSALSPYGKKGQEIFQQRMQIEQLAAQEKEKTKQESLMKKKSKALSRYLKGEELNEDEENLFSPQEWVAIHKARNPKAPATPVSERPVPPEQIENMRRAREIPGYDQMSETKKYETLVEKGVSAQNAEKEAKLSSEENKRAHEKYTDDRDYNAKISRPIIQEAQDSLKTSQVQKGLEKQLRTDIASGNTSGLFPFMVEKLGLESWRNPESARFTNEVKNLFLGSLQEIPGARPNQFIERVLSTAQPMIGRSPEANLSVLDVADFVRDVNDEHSKLVLKNAKQDREKYGYAKDDISERAWDDMGDYVNRRQEKMAIDIRERHEKDKSTSDLISEVLKGEVPPGTPLTPKMMKIFYIKNNKDIKKAVAEAKKSNFVLPEYSEQ